MRLGYKVLVMGEHKFSLLRISIRREEGWNGYIVEDWIVVGWIEEGSVPDVHICLLNSGYRFL